MSLFSSVEPVRFEGPAQKTSLPIGSMTRIAWFSASAWRNGSRSPCATGIPSTGPARISLARGTLTAPLAWHAGHPGHGRCQARRRVRFLLASGRALFYLSRCRRHGHGRHAQGTRSRTCARSRRAWPQKWRPPGSSCCGARPICSAIRAMPAAPPPVLTRRSTPGRPRRCAAAWKPRIGSAAKTTCCGADAKATTRC